MQRFVRYLNKIIGKCLSSDNVKAISFIYDKLQKSKSENILLPFDFDVKITKVQLEFSVCPTMSNN